MSHSLSNVVAAPELCGVEVAVVQSEMLESRIGRNPAR